MRVCVCERGRCNSRLSPPPPPPQINFKGIDSLHPTKDTVDVSGVASGSKLNVYTEGKVYVRDLRFEFSFTVRGGGGRVGRLELSRVRSGGGGARVGGAPRGAACGQGGGRDRARRAVEWERNPPRPQSPSSYYGGDGDEDPGKPPDVFPLFPLAVTLAALHGVSCGGGWSETAASSEPATAEDSSLPPPRQPPRTPPAARLALRLSPASPSVSRLAILAGSAFACGVWRLTSHRLTGVVSYAHNQPLSLCKNEEAPTRQALLPARQ